MQGRDRGSRPSSRAPFTDFIDAWNDHKKPFAWVRTSDEILAKAIPKAMSAGLH